MPFYDSASKRLQGWYACKLILLALLLFSCTRGNQQEVSVFAAASLRDAMDDLGAQFEAETGIRVVLNSAGSHVLAQQILATAQADIYLSAHASWVDTLEAAGRVVPDTRTSLLTNTLAVVGHAQRTETPNEPCALATLPFTYLALGNPDAVPAGRYARTWLEGQTCASASLWEQLADHVAPTPDVRAALSLVRAEPDIIGIVYKTDYLAFAEHTRLLYEVPQSEGPTIEYVIAQLTDAPQPDAARLFLTYARSTEARSVFEAHGFTMLRLQPSDQR